MAPYIRHASWTKILNKTHQTQEFLVPLLNESFPSHAQRCCPSEPLISHQSSWPPLPRWMWGTTAVKVGVEFILLKITKQRPSGAPVCSLFANANENKLKMINMKDLHNFTRNYSRKVQHCTVCFFGLWITFPHTLRVSLIYWAAKAAFSFLFFFFPNNENFACPASCNKCTKRHPKM